MVNRNNTKRYCYRKCMDWTYNTHNQIDDQLQYDINELKNGEKLIEKNINIVILVFLLLFFCFLTYIFLSLKSK